MLPNVPTLAEHGYPNTDASNWYGAAGAGEDAARGDRQAQHRVQRALNDPAVKDKLVKSGAIPVGDTPEQFGAFLKAEYAHWGKVVRERGIKDTPSVIRIAARTRPESSAMRWTPSCITGR